MNPVTVCPNTLEGVINASELRRCGTDQFGKNQYMCLPNVEKTSLFDFCYDGIMGIQEGGNCLEVNTTDGTLSTENCTAFTTGCPENVFWNHQFYEYPACQNINQEYHCYTSQPGCPPIPYVDVISELWIAVIVIAVLFIPLTVCYWIFFKIRYNGKAYLKGTEERFDEEQEIELILNISDQTNSPTADAKKQKLTMVTETPDQDNDNSDQRNSPTAKKQESEMLTVTSDNSDQRNSPTAKKQESEMLTVTSDMSGQKNSPTTDAKKQKLTMVTETPDQDNDNSDQRNSPTAKKQESEMLTVTSEMSDQRNFPTADAKKQKLQMVQEISDQDNDNLDQGNLQEKQEPEIATVTSS